VNQSSKLQPIGCQCLRTYCSKSPWWHLTVFVVKDQDTTVTETHFCDSFRLQICCACFEEKSEHAMMPAKVEVRSFNSFRTRPINI